MLILGQTHFGKLFIKLFFLKKCCVVTCYIWLCKKVHHIWYCIWENVWFVDMEKWGSFVKSLIRKSWILWYIGKFKDAYLVLLFGKLIENIFDKNEVENLTNFVEVRLFKVFWNYLDINCVWKYIYTYELYVILILCHWWFSGDHPIWLL